MQQSLPARNRTFQDEGGPKLFLTAFEVVPLSCGASARHLAGAVAHRVRPALRIGFSKMRIARDGAAVWPGSPGRHDDVPYRIHFRDAICGLAVGDPVKFRGVDVETVESPGIDPDDLRLVLVDLHLNKETPVKTDTRASLALKGITGVVYIELSGGDPTAQTLLAVTPQDQVPEIPSEKTGLKAMLDNLPTLVEKFSSIEDQVKKFVTSVGNLKNKVKENPPQLLRRPEKDSNDAGRK